MRKISRVIILEDEIPEFEERREDSKVTLVSETQSAATPQYETPRVHREKTGEITFAPERTLDFEGSEGAFVRNFNASRSYEMGERADATSRLSRRVIALIEGSASGMLGVFGMYADTIVKNVLENLRNPNVIIFGFVNTKFSTDIYNNIAACILKYMSENTRYNYKGQTDYETNMIYRKLSEIYTNEIDDDDYCESGLRRLVKISNKHNRNEKIIDVIGDIKDYFTDRNDYSSREKKFIIVVEIGNVGFDYSILKNLLALNSPSLIIIVTTMLPVNMARTQLSSSVSDAYTDSSFMASFFQRENIIEV